MAAIDLISELAVGNYNHFYIGLHPDHPLHGAMIDYLLDLAPSDRNFDAPHRRVALTTGGQRYYYA